MVVAHLVNHYESLAFEHSVVALTTTDGSRQSVSSRSQHTAPIKGTKIRESQQFLTVMAPEGDPATYETYHALTYDEDLSFDHDLFCSCPEPLPDTVPTDIPIYSTIDFEPEFPEPVPQTQPSLDNQSETETVETRRRSSSGAKSRDSSANSASSSSSLPCLSRSSSVTSGSSPVTPKRELPTFTLTSAEAFESHHHYPNEITLPRATLEEDEDDDAADFSQPESPREPKGKERETSTETFTFSPPRSFNNLEESLQPSLLAAQMQAGFRYSLHDRQFHSQISLSYMPTIHENFQSLPFLNEDPCAQKVNKRRSMGPNTHYRSPGVPSYGGFSPINRSQQHLAVHQPPLQQQQQPQQPQRPLTAEPAKTITKRRSVLSLRSMDSTSTTRSKRASLVGMPKNLFDGFRKYYFAAETES